MKAIFLRVLEETEDKNRALREAIASPDRAIGRTRFEVKTQAFCQVPRSPFAYWVSDRVRAIFAELPAFEAEGRTAKVGLQTSDDFRFVRFWPEVSAETIARRWFLLAKGGKFSPIYADVSLIVDWEYSGRCIDATSGSVIRNPDYYFRPGLTWLRRTRRLCVSIFPRAGIFSDGNQGIFAQDDLLLELVALLNSSVADALVKLSVGAVTVSVQFMSGMISSAPFPDWDNDARALLRDLAHRYYSLKRSFDTSNETSHAFQLPALLQVRGDLFEDRATTEINCVAAFEAQLARLQAEIDDCCFELYGIHGADREQAERGLGGDASADATGEPDEAEGVDTESAELDAVPLVASLLSWTVGVAFGRFDLRLATGERLAPPEPEPFDPLPVCSPGMLTGEDGLPLNAPPAGYAIGFPHGGILVDDAGADRDLVAAARQVFEPVFDDPAARWEETAEILGDRDRALRGWLAREFFELHIKGYSKSRRKAPIYWQLATASASYSAWLYYHRFTRDTLFRLLNDHIAPKLQHEERKLTNLTQDAGPNPTAGQRKEIDAQETLVGELRAFRDEVARVAPLWNPNLNDGVILNFAPLWRLVPQHRAWQKECKSAWDKLCKGDYDWAHLAMHLWPERVVPKCTKDRSLAIAHGLEEVFWHEDEDGKWQPKTVSKEEVAGLVAERTAPAVKDALNSLLEAPAPAGGRGRAPRRKKTTTPRAKRTVPSTNPAEPRERVPHRSTSIRTVDSAVLDQIRSAIATLGGNAAKSDILDAAGLSASQWTPAITALLADGSVTKTGQKRGTRYHLPQNSG